MGVSIVATPGADYVWNGVDFAWDSAEGGKAWADASATVFAATADNGLNMVSGGSRLPLIASGDSFAFDDVRRQMASAVRAEAIGFAETYIDLIAFVLSVSEALAVTEAAPRAVQPRPHNELLGIGEAALRDIVRSFASALVLADTRAGQGLKVAADPLAILDAASRATTLARTTALALAEARATTIARDARQALAMAETYTDLIAFVFQIVEAHRDRVPSDPGQPRHARLGGRQRQLVGRRLLTPERSMPQTYPDIPSTKAVRDSRQDILDRDEAVRSAFSGTTFPSTNLVVGMFCFRTDLGQVYELTATSPVTWTRIPLGVPVPVGQGGTGATDAAVARTNLGLAALAVKNTVAAADIDNAAITSAKIADGNVTTTKIPDGQISAAKIIDAAVTSAKLADNAVTTAKIAAGSITSAKIAAGTIYLSGDIVAMRVGNPAEGALYLGNSDNYSRSLVYAGGQYVLTNSPLNVSYIKGGSGDAGALKSYNSGNIINFGWQNDSVFYRVDDVVHRNICTQTNAKDLALAGGTGAPTGVSLNVHTMSGTLFGIFADQSSDERLKFDIRPTLIDALETLKNIEVCSYSLHPQIAAWFAAEGKDNDTSAQLAQDAEPVAVPIGFIAQQLQQHVPDAVRVLEQTPGISPLPTDLHTLNLPALMPYLVRAIQQQQAELARLRADLSALTAQVA